MHKITTYMQAACMKITQRHEAPLKTDDCTHRLIETAGKTSNLLPIVMLLRVATEFRREACMHVE